MKYRETGEMAQPGQPVLRIDDPSVIEVSAFCLRSIMTVSSQGQLP